MDGLDQIMQESIEIMEKDFYNKPFNFSYSSINKLLWNPQAFYQHYILGNREEKTESYLVNGKVVHALLLEEDKFDEQFIVSPANLPTGSTRSVVDRVYAHATELQANGDQRTEFVDFSDAVLDVLKDINLHQSLKTDQQRIDKMYTAEAMNYWEFLKSKGNKTLIDQETYEFCKTGVELVKLNKQVSTLMGKNTSEFDNVQIYNEYPLECKINSKAFGLKGIVDNLVIDHDRKILYINDVKTTSKDLKDFPETVDFYNYWLQASIYASLVATNYYQLMAEGYQIKFSFIVIDKNYQVYPFQVSDPTLMEWMNKLQSTLDKAEWHYVNKSYDLPYEFAVGSVIL